MKLDLVQAKEKSFTRRKHGSNLQEVEALRYKNRQQQQEQELSKQQVLQHSNIINLKQISTKSLFINQVNETMEFNIFMY